MISTDEFFDTLRVRIDRELETQGELEGDNKENILTRIMIEDLSSGNNPAIRGAQEIYTYANTNINAKINGFFIDDAENSVIVYITALNSSNELRRLNSHEVESLFKKLHSFMLNIVKNPSRMFDIIHEEPYTITEDEANYFHLYQTLIGDTADNYKGCPGIGPVTAHRLLSVSPTWATVKDAFALKGLSEDDALLQARIARILRATDVDANYKPILWKPGKN